MGCQEIEEVDANEEIWVLANDIVESASLPVPEGLGSKIRRNRRKQRKMCAGSGARGGGSEIDEIVAFDEIDEIQSCGKRLFSST